MQPAWLLDRAIFSYSDVDRLVGLHSGTAIWFELIAATEHAV